MRRRRSRHDRQNSIREVMKVKRSVAAAGAIAVVLGLSSPVLAQEDINVVVVSHGQAADPFWSVVKNGVQAAADDMGVSVDYRAPETFDMVAMGQLIEAAVNQEPDGLVVSIPDADALGPAIERAVQAGIPVISMNSGGDVSQELGAELHVGQGEYDAGLAAGQKLKEMGSTKGICVNMEVGNVALDQRCQGYADGLEGDVQVLPTSNDPAEVNAKVKAALESDPDVDSILSAGFIAGEPMLRAVQELNKTDSVHAATFDLPPAFMQAVADGEAAFGIDQQQYLQGYLPVVFHTLHARYGLIPGGDVPSGPNLVTQEKAEQVIDLAAEGIR